MWYYARGEEQIGPIEEGAFRILVDQRIVGPSTLVWREGMPSWIAYQEIAGTVTDWGTPCSECGRPHLVEELIEFEGRRVCVDCKDTFFQRLREGTAPLDEMRYSSSGKRIAAFILDSLFMNVVMFPLFFVGIAIAASLNLDGRHETESALAMVGVFVLVFFWVAFYFVWFVGRFGATPGKMILGMKIVKSDGGRVTYLRAFCRFLANQLSGSIMYIGYIIAFFDDQRRALHDHICDTRVIDK